MTAGKLRILQVMRAPVGGLFRHVADLTRELSDHGHSVGLVVDSLANDAQTESRLTELAPHVALGIHRFDMPRVLGRGDLITPLAVRKLAKSLDINVLHGHGAKGGFYARLARLGGSKAVAIYTPHGGVLHFDKSSASGRVFHMLERWLMGQTGAIVFESAYAQATYGGLIGAPTCPTRVIHNGLAADEFVPVPANADAADFVFVGELRDLKGIHVLIQALAGVRRADGSPATLVMAGDGSSRDALVAQVNQLGLEERVSLIGAQPARPSFARGRIAVVPSLAESLPYIVLEAAAAQLPVIATRVGGIPEIYGPTSSSLIAANDAVALQGAMQAALDAPEATRQEAVQRAAYVAERFSLARMAGDIEALYGELTAPA
ncbi:glycosyltransferase family 4 protein [Devosia neptuniae]|jgi:glycosyltransferase involved in cell wall biosynthesis|uniref:glycosyltransferase family 4 protein n=1 Tax=Devosia TaxID=46913 RepID=UPI0022AE8AB5|nr:glycosyltransferase family 4 protein [Devosia neptuniae]MCZ4346214.1 glycosyltransferase family 4 protein [Devosia neptuniae]|tara:strand:+ start:3908 stop:5038 length:1131 start_codon:yes stop_codon:yes gene_type:complete